jgi:hypothetical protein
MMPARLLLALGVWLCGCSTAAKISLVTGGQVEAQIQRSDQDNLFVETETGAEVPIARSEVSDIDHPGNGVAVVGGALTVYGISNIAVVASTCGQQKLPEVACVSAYIPAALGVSMLTWGLVTWFGSTGAAANSMPQGPSAVPLPPSPSPFEFSPGAAGGWPNPRRER